MACELCQQLGCEDLHLGPAGGDDLDGPLRDPSEPVDGEPSGGSGSYVISGGKWPQPSGLGTPVTVTYSYNNLLDGGLLRPNGQPLPRWLIRQSIEDALGVWASAAPLHFVEVEDQGGPVYFGTPYPNGQFGQIRFNHRYINGPDPPGGPPTAKAQAYYPSTGGNLGGDVFFDNGDPWQKVGTLSVPDVLGAAVHELGHSLGLGHTTVADANMYWIFTRYSGPGTAALHADDLAGIQAVYGAGEGSVTPLPIPEPASWLMMTVAALGGLVLVWRRRV